jgi:hypothetical protein
MGSAKAAELVDIEPERTAIGHDELPALVHVSHVLEAGLARSDVDDEVARASGMTRVRASLPRTNVVELVWHTKK